MRKIILALLLSLTMATPVAASGHVKDLAGPFGELSKVESALKKLGMTIDKTSGADTKPDRIYAMQDMANLCKTSKMQVHSLNSLFSVVKLVKMDKKFKNTEAELLKKKCGYAFKDFSRRKAFINDVLAKAKDQQLKDLAHIFEAQLSIIIKQLKAINSELN